MFFVMIMPCLARRVLCPLTPKWEVSRGISASHWEVTLGYHERIPLQSFRQDRWGYRLPRWVCWKHPWEQGNAPGHNEQTAFQGGPLDASHSLVYCCALTYISSVYFINLILMRLDLGRQAWKSYHRCLFRKFYKWIPLLFAMSFLLDVSQSYFSGRRKCHLSLGTGVNRCLHLRSQLITRFMLKYMSVTSTKNEK